MTAALYGRLPELAAPQSRRSEPVDEQLVEENEQTFGQKNGIELANLKSGNFSDLSDGYKFHEVRFFDSQKGSFADDFAPKTARLADSANAGLRSLPSVELVI